ncbi:MAG: prolyl oligopeptidase family serine peptidase [Bacteroidota bacterium]
MNFKHLLPYGPIKLIWITTIFVLTSAATGQLPVIRSESGFTGAVKVIGYEKTDTMEITTVSIPYLGMEGDTLLGEAKLYFRADQPRDSIIPVYCGVHYQMDQGQIRKYLDMGMMVVTPIYDTYSIHFAIGNSINQSQAMVQWVRRLPFTDLSRLVIGGGSAGGYMALAMGSEFFPLAAVTSELPLLNWSYGVNYLLSNQVSSDCYNPELEQRPLPVLGIIAPWADIAMELFGEDLTAKTWYHHSTISYTGRITAPTLVTASTADMLCTIGMFTTREFFQMDTLDFPGDYVRDFDSLTLVPEARITLEGSIPEQDLAIHFLEVAKDQHQYTLDDLKIFSGAPLKAKTPKEVDLPWTPNKPWNLAIANEGAPLPYNGHTRYVWNTFPRSFISHHLSREIETRQLNAEKLQRLLERYMGQLSVVATLASGKPANRLNFSHLEQRDVVTGLLEYARTSPAHARRLKELYNASDIKPFGAHLDLQTLQNLAAATLKQDSINHIRSSE